MKATKVFAALMLLGTAAILFAGQFPRNTPYYEKDAWYDVSEWFDGNDFNPTDEAWWRWDDETYQAANDTGRDRDNDGWYGYSTNNSDRWFYDYYDPYPYGYYNYAEGLYGYGFRYYDYDNDGLYDAYATYYDRDRDGFFEDYNYYSFTDISTDQQRKRANDQVNKTSREANITGTIQKTKNVQVRGGKKHLVASIEPKDQKAEKDKTVLADLGKLEGLAGLNLTNGTKITVRGPRARVGDHIIILAKSIELKDKRVQIDRHGRDITGKVISTHKTKIRGVQHLIAMVETKQKDKSRRIAVDLGQADRLKVNVDKGSNLTFSGFPVKVNNKQLIMAQSVQKDGQEMPIDRGTKKSRPQEGKK